MFTVNDSGIRTRSRAKAIRNAYRSRLPEDLHMKIFSLLPPQDIASSCALVSRYWRYYSCSETLWKDFCERGGLRDPLDTTRFKTWRDLYAAVYGTNLIGSPYFQRIDRIDAKILKARVPRICEPKYNIYPDRLYSEDERHEEPHSYCHWMCDGGSRFQRGGGDGIIRECPPADCQPFPGAPGEPVLATSYDWGKVYQFVDLNLFPRRFLDQSPPLVLSVWYAGRKGTIGLFRIQVGLQDKNNKIIFSNFSGDLRAQPNKWKEAKEVIFGYPKGMRSVVVKFCGRSMGKKNGFHGTKYTAIRLKFTTVTEAVVQIFESCSTPSMSPSITEESDTRFIIPKRA
ncbi:unnamed protein product [Calypogeia fissa]